MNKAPNFLIVGVPRAGTTSIWNYLKEHPEVFMPEQKYPRYFGEEKSVIMPHIHNNKKEYLKQFEGVKENHKAIGEGSHYFHSKIAPEQISKFNPEMKIVIILRNPADILYSHLFMDKFNNDKIEDYLWARNNLRYSRNIKRYLKYFKRENIHIIIFEEFFNNNTQKEFDKLCYFLEISQMTSEFKNFNPKTKVKNRWIHWIYFKVNPEKRYSFLNNIPNFSVKLLKSVYKFLAFGKKQKCKITKEEKEKILYWYEDEIKKTEKLLGRNLDIWRIKNEN